MEYPKAPENINDEKALPRSEQLSQKSNAFVPETQASVGVQIRALKEKIRELEEGKEKITLLQKTYNVPDEGLTEGDLATLQTSDVELREKLSVLLEQKKNTPSLVRKLARRAAAFLSL